MLDCTDCGRCPRVQFMEEERPRVLCERAMALRAANEAARRARLAAVSLVDVLDELRALRDLQHRVTQGGTAMLSQLSE